MTNLQNYSAFDYKGTCGIYKICIKNHIYVGSSKVLKNRLRNHYNSLKNGKHFSNFLQSCVNKYTMEETFFDILEYCVEGDLAERETYYIQHLKADINQIYDVVRLKRTEECSRRQSARQKEYYKTHRPVNCKKVYVYDPYGNFYKEFDSAAKTAKFFNVDITNVTSSIKRGSLCLMYRCSYVKHEKLPSLQYAQIVKQFDKFGNLVKVWDSIYHICFDLQYDLKTFCKALRTKQLFKGYLWKKGDPIKPRTNTVEGKIVYQYDLEGNYLNSYVSCNEAERQTGARGVSSIARENKPSFKKSCGGFLWSYTKWDKLPKYTNNSAKAKIKAITIYDIFANEEHSFESRAAAVRHYFPNCQNFDSMCATLQHKQIIKGRFLFKYAKETQYIIGKRTTFIYNTKTNKIYENSNAASKDFNVSPWIIKQWCKDSKNQDWKYATEVAREKLCESGKLLIS